MIDYNSFDTIEINASDSIYDVFYCIRVLLDVYDLKIQDIVDLGLIEDFSMVYLDGIIPTNEDIMTEVYLAQINNDTETYTVPINYSVPMSYMKTPWAMRFNNFVGNTAKLRMIRNNGRY